MANSELEELAEQSNELVQRINENRDAEIDGLIKAYIPADGMIRVIDESGEYLEQQMKLGEYGELPGEFSTRESQEIKSVIHAADIAIITKPIIWTNGDIVTLQVVNHLIPLSETMNTLFYVLIILSIIMLIPAFIAGTLLSRFLLSPIQKLIETMKENTKLGKWKKIDMGNRSKDEIYEIGTTFNEMIEHLKDNYEKQEMFVSNASHELKTPIQIVKSYSQLLERRGKDNPELIQEAIEAMDSEADRMKKLVEQLLLLAKNKEHVEKEEVNFTELVKDTIRTFNGAYGRDIQLDVESDILVLGNKDQLEQVIYILIDNALKYSKERVDISLNVYGQNALLQVRDYGKGIPEEEQDRIFERFYRVDKARSRDTGGTGLGLAIAKVITEDHQGTLSVSSKLGEGSTFSLKLPAL